MAVLAFKVTGHARPAGSKRPVLAGGRLRTVDSSGPNGAAWRADIIHAAQQAMDASPLEFPLTGPLEVSLTFIIARPKGHYRTGRHAGTVKESAPPHPVTRPDVLKLARAAEDAMEAAGVFADDAAIVTERLAKRYPLPGLDEEQAGLRVEVCAA